MVKLHRLGTLDRELESESQHLPIPITNSIWLKPFVSMKSGLLIAIGRPLNWSILQKNNSDKGRKYFFVLLTIMTPVGTDEKIFL